MTDEKNEPDDVSTAQKANDALSRPAGPSLPKEAISLSDGEAHLSSAKASPIVPLKHAAPQKTPWSFGGATTLAAVIVAGASVAIGLFAFPLAAAAGNAAIPVLALAGAALAVGVAALIQRRHEPEALRAGFIGVAIAALGAGLAAGFAAMERQAAANLQGDPADVAYRLGEGQAKAHAISLLGFVTLPAIGLSLLALGLSLRARRVERAAAIAQGGKGESIVLATMALVFASLLGVASVGSSAYGALSPVVRTAHPNTAKVEAAAALSQDPTKLKEACEALETVLEPSFVPPELLDKAYPHASEVAHKCVSDKIDHLPKGLSCRPVAVAQSKSNIVQRIDAASRLLDACDKPFK